MARKGNNKSIVFYLTLGVTIILLTAGFILPPMGIIDSSVIKASGILAFFGVVGQLPAIIESSKIVRMSSGDTSIEITARGKDEGDCE